MLEAAYEIIISMISMFLAGTMLGWFLKECQHTHNKIKEAEKQYVTWYVPDHANCRCSIGIEYPEDGVDDDEQM